MISSDYVKQEAKVRLCPPASGKSHLAKGPLLGKTLSSLGRPYLDKRRFPCSSSAHVAGRGRSIDLGGGFTSQRFDNLSLPWGRGNYWSHAKLLSQK